MNICFFHTHASIRKKSNHIQMLNVNESEFIGTDHIGKAATDFYNKRFMENKCWSPFLNLNLSNKLREEDAISLVDNFSEQDVFCAIKEIDPFKAPGP